MQYDSNKLRTARDYVAYERNQRAVRLADASARRSKNAKTSPLRQSGTGSGLVAGVLTDLDPNIDLRGPKWYGDNGTLGVSRAMLRDPHVRQSVEYIAGPLTSGFWTTLPGGKDALAREIADYIAWAFFEYLPWHDVLRRQVQTVSADGVGLFELTTDMRPFPTWRFPLLAAKSSMGLVPTGFHEIPAATIERWRANPYNAAQLAGIQQYISYSDTETAGYRELPINNILRLTWDQEAGNYTGLAPLRSAYQPWKLKLAFLALDAIRHERQAVGIPVLTLAEDVVLPDDITAAETILAEMRSHEKGYVILPHGYTFEWSDATGKVVTDLNMSIERCNKDIAINATAGYMMLGLTGQSSSYALGATQQSGHHLAVEGWGRFISNALTHGTDGWSPVQRIVDANYGEYAPAPQIVVKSLPTYNWTDVARTVNNCVTVGAIYADDVLEDELRKMMRLPPADKDTARVKTQGFVGGDTKEKNKELGMSENNEEKQDDEVEDSDSPEKEKEYTEDE